MRTRTAGDRSHHRHADGSKETSIEPPKGVVLHALLDLHQIEDFREPGITTRTAKKSGPPWGQTEFQVNLKLGLTSHACIQSPGHSQDGPSNHAPTRSVCTAAAVASLRARFSHSCGINVSLASLGRYARTCERYHGLFSPGSRPTGSSQTLSSSPTGLRARWACGLMVLGATKC